MISPGNRRDRERTLTMRPVPAGGKGLGLLLFSSEVYPIIVRRQIDFYQRNVIRSLL